MQATPRPVMRIDNGAAQRIDDTVAVEEPLEIRLGTRALAITMRTPGHDHELAAGFCFTEGVIAEPHELISVATDKTAKLGNVMRVKVSDETIARREAQIGAAQREFYLSSSCGVCGKQSIDRIRCAIRPIRGEFTVPPEVLASLPGAMRGAQATFESTGGLHAAALFDPAGKLIVLREDVGRHNAVDKVIGHMLLDAPAPGRVPIDPGILLISGRTSFEIVQKAAVAGIAMIAAVSAPSSLAIDFANETGQTLIGFLRPGRMNVYTHPHRVQRQGASGD